MVKARWEGILSAGTTWLSRKLQEFEDYGKLEVALDSSWIFKHWRLMVWPFGKDTSWLNPTECTAYVLSSVCHPIRTCRSSNCVPFIRRCVQVYCVICWPSVCVSKSVKYCIILHCIKHVGYVDCNFSVSIALLLFSCAGYPYSMKGSALPEFRGYDVTVPRIYNRNLTLNVSAAEVTYNHWCSCVSIGSGVTLGHQHYNRVQRLSRATNHVFTLCVIFYQWCAQNMHLLLCLPLNTFDMFALSFSATVDINLVHMNSANSLVKADTEI